jgi:hypothetical protein
MITRMENGNQFNITWSKWKQINVETKRERKDLTEKTE